MNRWLIIILLFLVSMLFLVCSEEKIVTNDDDNGNTQPIDTVFTIACVGNSEAAVTQTIHAETGGSITTTSTNNVIITLTVPAYSLANDTDITLTPLASFDLTGPFLITCVDTSGVSGICFEGILCEPTGIMFDSGATLTVEFPADQPFPFDSSTTITYFDTSNAVFYIYPTIIDPGNRLLSCNLNHFSGYVTNGVPYMTEEDLCTILYSSFQQLQAGARNHLRSAEFVRFIIQIIELKASNHYTNTYNPDDPTPREIECPNFNEMVDAEMYTLLTHHWSVLQEIWTEGGVDYIPSMISDLESLYRVSPYISNPTAQNALEQILKDMRLFINDRIREMANEGHTLCQTNYEPDCNRGRELLSRTIAYGEQGYIITSGFGVDDVYLQQVEDWLADCCSEDIHATLTVPVTTTIYRLAIDPDDVYGDQYSYVCSLNVNVAGANGTPLESVPVSLWREGQSYKITTKSSDENGNAGFIIEPRVIDFGCQEYVTQTFYATAYNASNQTWTNPVGYIPVMFVNAMIKTTISYQYDYSWVGGDYSAMATAMLNGSGTGPIKSVGTCSDNCSGQLTRTYSYSNCTPGGCYGGTSIDDNETYACRAIGDIRTLLLDNGKGVEFLFAASVSLGGSIYAGLVYTNTDGSLDTLQYGLESSVWPEEGFYFPASGSSIVGDTTWTYDSSDDPNMVGLKTVTYRVTVELK